MPSAPIDIHRVRQLFSRPKKRQADFIYREIASRMVERLQLIKLAPKQIVDAGCGHGADLRVLHTMYPHTKRIGVDASLAMLTQQTSLIQRLARLFSGKSNIHFVNGDFGDLPLSGQSTDLIWSNLALHWHPEPDRVFDEWRRVLRTDGLLLFSCFGPDSFKEIRHAFNDDAPHTLSFVDMHDLGDMLTHVGFATPVMDMELITLTYETVPQLLAEVRTFGGNPLTTQRRGLLGKTAWQALCDKLEQARQPNGRIPLTLEIIYGHAFKPMPSKTKAGESVIRFHR